VPATDRLVHLARHSRNEIDYGDDSGSHGDTQSVFQFPFEEDLPLDFSGHQVPDSSVGRAAMSTVIFPGIPLGLQVQRESPMQN
jgi:hypothetical protein